MVGIGKGWEEVGKASAPTASVAGFESAEAGCCFLPSPVEVPPLLFSSCALGLAGATVGAAISAPCWTWGAGTVVVLAGCDSVGAVGTEGTSSALAAGAASAATAAAAISPYFKFRLIGRLAVYVHYSPTHCLL